MKVGIGVVIFQGIRESFISIDNIIMMRVFIVEGLGGTSIQKCRFIYYGLEVVEGSQENLEVIYYLIMV